jgi:hypothetical protein
LPKLRGYNNYSHQIAFKMGKKICIWTQTTGCLQTHEMEWKTESKTERIREWSGIIILDVIEYTFYCISYFNMCDGI